VNQIDFHNRHGIVPLHWFGIHLRLCQKTLQKYIVSVHLGFIQSHIVSPCLHYGVKFFAKVFLTTIEFFPSCEMAVHPLSTLTKGKVPCLRMHLKRFVKLHELKHGQQVKLAFEFPKGFVTRLIPPFE